jgi:uncharacterized protein
MNEKDNLLKFPCAFPLKIIGLNSDEFHSVVTSILRRHAPDQGDLTTTSNLSSSNKYISITAVIDAKSKDQMDAIYREMNNHKLVLMVL